MKISKHNINGFSLIETMVAVAILGIISTIAIADFTKFSIRAKYQRARSELGGVSTLVSGMRITEEKYLFELTGNSCSACSGTPAATWVALGYPGALLDPWGQTYHMDENDGEFGPTSCSNDSLWSGGNDATYSGVGDGLTAYNDDLIVRIAHRVEMPSCPTYPTSQVGPTYSY